MADKLLLFGLGIGGFDFFLLAISVPHNLKVAGSNPAPATNKKRPLNQAVRGLFVWPMMWAG
ncbi:MAG: hypothetical protein RID59_19515, partial [Hoeflea sp.]